MEWVCRLRAEVESAVFSSPGARRAFTFRFGNGYGRRVAESEQDLFHLFVLPAVQLAQRSAKGFQAEIILATGTFDAVKESGDFNQPVPGVQEIQVENLLLSHLFLFTIDDFLRRGKS